MSSSDEEKLRRTVTLRFVSYAIFVGLLTGLGLFFYAGVRDATSWAWFVLGGLAAVAGLACLVRSTLDSSFESAPPKGVLDPDRTTNAPAIEVAEGGEEVADDDEVDYLTALRHEFRTPLNAVLGFSDVLLSGIDGEVNESQREDLEIIRASGIRLKLLLDSALVGSRKSNQKSWISAAKGSFIG